MSEHDNSVDHTARAPIFATSPVYRGSAALASPVTSVMSSSSGRLVAAL